MPADKCYRVLPTPPNPVLFEVQSFDANVQNVAANICLKSQHKYYNSSHAFILVGEMGKMV
ncbi:hypothetical protein OSCI_3400030 [Kamptonema sp. PCC 6506]|nr:hypothetical protein OSCI_3400030 [Kamptonema sp. PCC 6506]